jgi:flagellar biosynthesis/type III secretory pathway M-ring protein FliF/YscJ
MTFKSITGITVNNQDICIKGLSSFACVCKECQKELNQLINKHMTTKTNRVRKVSIKTIKPHTKFAEEIYQQQKIDIIDRAFWTTCVIIAICAIILVIVNIK